MNENAISDLQNRIKDERKERQDETYALANRITDLESEIQEMKQKIERAIE